MPRSSSTVRAALRPGRPDTEPPGWLVAPVRNSPRIPVAYDGQPGITPPERVRNSPPWHEPPRLGLCGRRARHGPDAHHRHLPGLPEPGPGAGLRGRARPGHRQRRDRHLAHRLAALCAAGAGRDASIARSDFIAAVVLQGASTPRILFRHIVPLCLSSVIVRLTLDMAGIILTAAGLGFLGLGAQPPTAGMGRHGRRRARSVMLDQWWVATIPGLAIFIVSLGFNLLGDGLRDVLDPEGRDERTITPLLDVENLCVTLPGRDGVTRRRCAASPSRSAASGSASSASRARASRPPAARCWGCCPDRGRSRPTGWPSTGIDLLGAVEQRDGATSAAAACRWSCRTRNSR